jgi:integrase
VGTATISASYRLLRADLKRALASRYISWDPTAAVQAPKARSEEMRFLAPEEVDRLAEAHPERYRVLVYLLAYGGPRIGEAAALRVGDLDLLRGRLTISRAATEVKGRLEVGPTKTGKVRTISLPSFLRQMLASHLERFPSPDGLVFTGPGGGPLRPNNFRKRVFYPATKAAGLAHLRVHDLRHTCAALLFAQGAPVKAVSDRLGHSNPTVTLNVYAHVIPAWTSSWWKDLRRHSKIIGDGS